MENQRIRKRGLLDSYVLYIYILDNRYDQHDGEDGVICLGVRRT